MIEISITKMVLSVLFVLGTYVAFAWALWMGYKGINADAPPFHEGGHAVGGKGTYDDHCHIGDRSCADLRKSMAA